MSDQSELHIPELPDQLPKTTIPRWDNGFERDGLLIERTGREPFEVYFTGDRDTITMTLDHPGKAFVAFDSDRVVASTGLPGAMHFHPAGATVFCDRRDAQAEYAVIGVDASFRAKIADSMGIEDRGFETRINMVTPNSPAFGQMVRRFVVDGCQGGSLVAESLATLVMSDALSALTEKRSPQLRRHRSLSRGKLHRTLDYIEANLGQDLKLVDLADQAALSAFHFSRAFREATGKPPHAYVLSRRVERAKDLLVRSESSIAQIAFEFGFSSQSHFTTTFKKLTGVTPAQFRKGL